MFQQLSVVVVSQGEHVVLVLGSSSFTLHYQAALALSWRMRSAGLEAKRFAGDMSRIWSLLGTVHDAERGPDAGQPFTPGKVYPVNRDALPVERVGAKREARLVVVKLGSAEAQMPYRAALTIAQWLRLRAKEAKRRAGDTARHWSAIAIAGA